MTRAPNRIDVLHRAAAVAFIPDSEQEQARQDLKDLMRDWPPDLIIETLLDAVWIAADQASGANN